MGVLTTQISQGRPNTWPSSIHIHPYCIHMYTSECKWLQPSYQLICIVDWRRGEPRLKYDTTAYKHRLPPMKYLSPGRGISLLPQIRLSWNWSDKRLTFYSFTSTGNKCACRHISYVIWTEIKILSLFKLYTTYMLIYIDKIFNVVRTCINLTVLLLQDNFIEQRCL